MNKPPLMFPSPDLTLEVMRKELFEYTGAFGIPDQVCMTQEQADIYQGFLRINAVFKYRGIPITIIHAEN